MGVLRKTGNYGNHNDVSWRIVIKKKIHKGIYVSGTVESLFHRSFHIIEIPPHTVRFNSYCPVYRW